ncbi:MAG: hypothetical protein IT292_11105 [Deltaproteobacteria bacterium]|nr:hypothetical protein [Deltaproteobacteria bacterium]
MNQQYPLPPVGSVIAMNGNMLRATATGLTLGDIVSIPVQPLLTSESGTAFAQAKVVAYENDIYSLSLFTNRARILPKTPLYFACQNNISFYSANLLGSVIDPLGNIVKKYTAPIAYERNDLIDLRAAATPPAVFDRGIIKKQFASGLRVIDGLLSIGYGQRIAIFAEPGVGKSTLMSQIANYSAANINIIALIGERGREVVEMFEGDLNDNAKHKTIGVVSTSDQSALSRITAAHTATRLAQYYAQQGKNVLLQIDSLTRLFRAYREVGIASGETPVRRGYPPSVFADLPDLIERAGVTQSGSVTALYTVLLSSDLDEDPMVDEIKGLTDGHFILRKDLAERGHFPAIDPLSSLSRLANKLMDREQHQAVLNFLRHWQTLQNADELMALGGEQNAELKHALKHQEQLRAFLQQSTTDCSKPCDTRQALISLSNQLLS